MTRTLGSVRGAAGNGGPYRDPPVALGDAAYGDITEFRLGLDQREIDYVLDVKGSTSALPESARPARRPRKHTGRPAAARYRRPFGSLAELALAAGADACVEVNWREGTRGPMTSRFLALRVRPANVKLRHADPDGKLPVCWLLAEWPPGKQAPTDFWLSTLPARHPDRAARRARQTALADRTRLPRAKGRARPRPLRRALIRGLAPPRHPRLRRPRIPHHKTATPPANAGGRLTSLFEVARELQQLLACWQGTCPTCRRRLLPNTPYLQQPP